MAEDMTFAESPMNGHFDLGKSSINGELFIAIFDLRRTKFLKWP
jgi:hypothetical protein